MQIRNLSIVVIILIILGVGAWWYTHRASYQLPLAAGETVSSWDFQGAYEGNTDLTKKAEDEIARLEGQLGGDQSGGEGNPTDYELYVSIANQYNLLGDGAKEREYLEKALAIDSTHTGLAWQNLAALMSRLGAYATARTAYARSVEVQPQVEAYHLARLQFLIDHFASDEAALKGAFDEANAQFGDNASILQLEAQWYADTGKTEDAIAALEKMKNVVPQDVKASIDAQIQSLRSE